MSLQPVTLIIQILSALIVVVSLIPLIRHDHWTFRVFEFPRFQKWVINLCIGAAYLVFVGIESLVDGVFIALLFLNQGYLTYQIYPYLPFTAKQIKDADKNAKPDLRFLIYNVYQYNRKFADGRD
ncbi:MAG: hypothetical protein ABR574_12805 [Cryomorphaceae bacterium]